MELSKEQIRKIMEFRALAYDEDFLSSDSKSQ